MIPPDQEPPKRCRECGRSYIDGELGCCRSCLRKIDEEIDQHFELPELRAELRRLAEADDEMFLYDDFTK